MDFHGKKVAQSGTLIKSGVNMVNYIGTNKKNRIVLSNQTLVLHYLRSVC